jgi:hypothetical protein
MTIARPGFINVARLSKSAPRRISKAACFLLLTVSLAAPGPSAAQSYEGKMRWWKGNTHTHSWWSDGDTPPEVVADWYKKRGYNFLVFSDHNIMQQGEKWYPIERDATKKALKTYEAMFGADWVEDRQVNGKTEVRLKTLDEFRGFFEEPGSFTFIKGEEISDRFRVHPIHLNGVNLVEKVEPQGGHSVSSVIQNNVNAVVAQGAKFGQPMLIHLNHPNFHYAVQAEDFFYLDHKPGEGFFEIYNGHPGVANDGDALHVSTERMWDIVLSKRLGELNRSVVYGMAVDDAHEYTAWGVGETNPGRGWIMVRAKNLSPNSIVAAMKRGDFYNSTGVTLKGLSFTDNSLSVTVDPRKNVQYTIEFVGTRKGADLSAKRQKVAHEHQGNKDHFHQEVSTYGEDIGTVLKTVQGPQATYRLTGDEIYVRARIISTAVHPNPFASGEVEKAWTQPLIAAKTEN